MTKSAKWLLWLVGFAVAYWVLQRTIPEHFDMPSNQRKAKNCPDKTRTTNGECLMEF